MDAVYQALVVTVAAFVAISFPCLLLAFLCRHRNNRLLEPDHRCASSSPLPISAPAGTSSELSSSWSLYGSAVDSSLKKLSLDDLARATGEFSPDNIIGDGSFGFVYRAVLPDGGPAVAVKRLSADHAAGAGNREFRAELEVLGSLSHRNLARLLGYCAAGRDRLLVYELLERGSLDAWLNGDAASVGGPRAFASPAAQRPRSPSCTTTATRPCSTATSSPATCYSTRGSRPSSPISAMPGSSPAALPRRISARRPPAQRGTWHQRYVKAWEQA
ncbi:hypothetical protein ZWY2020_052749 [Hordeum vulgare]|nr:hypothetical protein ZWY2020_052749 [Hordeum vulgare]